MASEIRVLLIDLSKRYGGASVRALTLARHLQSGGVAIAGLKGSPVLSLAGERGIPVRVVGKSRLDPMIPFRLRQIIRQDHFQVIDTQNIQSKFWGSLTARITDVAFVATLNSAYRYEQGHTLKGRFYALLDGWTSGRTDRFIAVSEAIRQNLLESGLPAGMIDLVTNAVEIEAGPKTQDPAFLRRQWQIPADAFICTSIGRLVWAKGQDDFITAFSSIADRLPKAYALIAGEGVLYPVLSRQIQAAGLEKRMILLGHCTPEKVLNVLRASDAFVLSSRSEGVPYALLEAAALGLPILSTRCGGIPDVLTDSVEALLVPVGDPKALAEGLIRFYSDRPWARQLGLAAQEKIRQNHAVKALIDAMQIAYRKACEHKWNRSGQATSPLDSRGTVL